MRLGGQPYPMRVCNGFDYVTLHRYLLCLLFQAPAPLVRLPLVLHSNLCRLGGQKYELLEVQLGQSDSLCELYSPATRHRVVKHIGDITTLFISCRKRYS